MQDCNVFMITENISHGKVYSLVLLDEEDFIRISDSLWLYYPDEIKGKISKLLAKFKLSGTVGDSSAEESCYQTVKEQDLKVLKRNDKIVIYDKKAQDEYLNKYSKELNTSSFKAGLYHLYFQGYKSMFNPYKVFSSISSFNGESNYNDIWGKKMYLHHYYYDMENNKVYAEYNIGSLHKVIIFGDNQLEMADYKKEMIQENWLVYRNYGKCYI
jgi:hypothetical protein